MFTDANQAKKFTLAGNARVTLVSLKTKTRYTYRVQEADDAPGMYFVALFTGQDNESDYSYIGMIRGSFGTTKASKLPESSPPVAAFKFFMNALTLPTPRIPTTLEVHHEGRCGRCNRALTVPESIESGFGPECIKMVA
jgi:hypothetical protein